jgi:hypothetical protein
MDSEMIESAAEIIANAGRYDPETKVDEKLLVRSVLIAFHVGFCAAQAKRDAADLASIVRID